MPDLELDVDPETPGFFVRDDYFGVLAQLRRDAPVRRYAPNAWTVARYADVREVSRDPERYCSSRGVLVNDSLRTNPGEVPGSILHMDPPKHGPWRKLTSRRFTPRAVNELEARVRDVARDVLAEVPCGEDVDFVEHVAAPFPVLVIAEILGIADRDRDDFRRWSDAAIEAPDDPAANVDDLAELHRFLVEHIERRRESPADDVTTAIANAEVDGRMVTTAEAVIYCLSLLVAGNETTRHLVSGSALALFEHPEQRAALAADPNRIPDAVEECLRWVTPIQAFGRTATRDSELGGVEIPAGDFVVLLYASANRDEGAFGPTAAAFDVARAVDATQLAFGFGEHLCLGATLARVEARILLQELLALAPDYDVTGEPDWVRSTLVRGMAKLPVRL